MASKLKITVFILILIHLALAIPAGAQEGSSATGSGYYLDTRGGRTRFVQRLSWSGGENALRYEVIIQRQMTFYFQDHRREFTARNFIEVTLQPGTYRFKVIPYDVLNRPGPESEWVNFEVLRAVKPELVDASAGFVSSSDDGDSGYMLNLLGSNIVDGAEIFIRDTEGNDFIPETFYSSDTNSISIFIEEGKLEAGEYEVFVRNPGGLEASMGGIILSPYDLIPDTEPIIKIEAEKEIEPEEIWVLDTLPIAVGDFGGSIYDIIDYPLTWEEAKAQAEIRGGRLATINSAKEQDYIFSLLSKYGEMNNYWIGGRLVDGEWQWITNEPFEYTNWAPGQPDNSDGLEEYLEIMRLPNPGIQGSRPGQWNDEINNLEYYIGLETEELHRRKRGFIIEYPDYEMEPELPKKEKRQNQDNIFVRFGLSYMPAFHLYGNKTKESEYLAGGAFRFNFAGKTPMNFYIGIELVAYWYTPDGFNTPFNQMDHHVQAGANILLMKWFANNKAAFGYRAGVVAGGLVSYNKNQGAPVYGKGDYHLTTGISFHWRIFNNFALEAGADYLNVFNTSASSTGVFRPWAGFAIQF